MGAAHSLTSFVKDIPDLALQIYCGQADLALKISALHYHIVGWEVKDRKSFTNGDFWRSKGVSQTS